MRTIKQKEGNLVGIVYSAVSTYEFRDLVDVNSFVESINSDMLYEIKINKHRSGFL